MMKRSRQQILPAPSSGPAALPPSSRAVPLPSSHIRRTPSELQLADEVKRAEVDDVRMYARLVVGMQSQIAARAYQAAAGSRHHQGGAAGAAAHGVGGGPATNAAGYVHPLSEKSLRGVVGTRLAKDEELFKDEDEYESNNPFEEPWENLLEGSQESHSADSSSLGWSTKTVSKSDSDGSLSSRESEAIRHVEEDDFVFCLEL